MNQRNFFAELNRRNVYKTQCQKGIKWGLTQEKPPFAAAAIFPSPARFGTMQLTGHSIWGWPADHAEAIAVQMLMPELAIELFCRAFHTADENEMLMGSLS